MIFKFSFLARLNDTFAAPSFVPCKNLIGQEETTPTEYKLANILDLCGIKVFIVLCFYQRHDHWGLNIILKFSFTVERCRTFATPSFVPCKNRSAENKPHMPCISMPMCCALCLCGIVVFAFPSPPYLVLHFLTSFFRAIYQFPFRATREKWLGTDWVKRRGIQRTR